MAHWFISYSHKNTKTVNRYKNLLEQVVGIDVVWRDDQIRPGNQNWWDELIGQIEACDVFVPMLSKGFFESQYCQVEIKHANDFRKPILPIRLEDIQMLDDIQYIQYVDFSEHLSDAEAIKQFEYAKAQLEEEIRIKPPKRPSPLPERPRDPGKQSNIHPVAGPKAEIGSTTTYTKPPKSLQADSNDGDLDEVTVESCMDKAPLFIYEDAEMGYAWLQIVGDGRPAYLIVKRRSDERIAGWLTKGILSDKWPTILWRDLGLSAKEHSILVDDISVEPVERYMVKPGALEYMTPELSFAAALERFTLPVLGEARHLSVRAYPVRDRNHNAVGAIDYRHILKKARDLGIVPDITVDQCMLAVDAPDFIPVPENATFSDVEKRLESEGWTSVAVTTKDMQLVGMISREKVKQCTDEKFPQVLQMLVKPYLRKPGDSYRAKPNSKLTDWISLFITDRQIDTIAVIKSENNHTLLGLLRYTDILQAILHEMKSRR